VVFHTFWYDTFTPEKKFRTFHWETRMRVFWYFFKVSKSSENVNKMTTPQLIYVMSCATSHYSWRICPPHKSTQVLGFLVHVFFSCSMSAQQLFSSEEKMLLQCCSIIHSIYPLVTKFIMSGIHQCLLMLHHNSPVMSAHILAVVPFFPQK
jgi:hypothetical protein